MASTNIALLASKRTILSANISTPRRKTVSSGPSAWNVVSPAWSLMSARKRERAAPPVLTSPTMTWVGASLMASSTPSATVYGGTSEPGGAGLASRVVTLGCGSHISSGSSIFTILASWGMPWHRAERSVVFPTDVPPTTIARSLRETASRRASMTAAGITSHSTIWDGGTGCGS